jgi:hypothetical protein
VLIFGDIELTVESIKNAATYQDLDEKVDLHDINCIVLTIMLAYYADNFVRLKATYNH